MLARGLKPDVGNEPAFSSCLKLDFMLKCLMFRSLSSKIAKLYFDLFRFIRRLMVMKMKI